MLAVVAAGGRAPQSLRARGIERVPLLLAGGETLLSRTCRCLAEGGGCEAVIVLAPEEVPLPDHPAVSRGRYTGAIVDDVVNCAEEHEEADQLLISGADMPLLTARAVAQLVDDGAKHRPQVLYPVVDRRMVEARVPGSKRTYLKLRGQVVTGGNIFVVDRRWLVEHAELLRKLFASRKNLLALMSMFGIWFFIRLLTQQADLRYLEQHLGRVVRARLRAALLPCPELAIDLDKEADLQSLAAYIDPPTAN
jgi:GTP:adenosylcobinamide-phosphate guanylyltransferase